MGVGGMETLMGAAEVAGGSQVAAEEASTHRNRSTRPRGSPSKSSLCKSPAPEATNSKRAE